MPPRTLPGVTHSLYHDITNVLHRGSQREAVQVPDPRSPLIDMAKRNLAHVEAGTVDQAPEVLGVPVRNYFDPERWQREMDRIFRRLPLVLGFSAELREPGDHRALEAAGV